MGVTGVALMAMGWALLAQQQTEIARKDLQDKLEKLEIAEKRRKAAEEINRQNHIESLKKKIRGFIGGEAWDLARDSLNVLENMSPGDPDILKLKSAIK
jgi:hypothetical protein